MKFSIDEYVRWSDVDAAGIICYGAYVRFFEIAETEMFRAAGVPHGEVFERFDIWLPRVRYACEFRAPARLDEKLRVLASVKRLGTTSIDLAFSASGAADALVAQGEVVLVCVDRANFRPQPLPGGLRTALTPYLDAP